MKKKLESLIEAYQGHFVEREDEIKGAFLAILANENLLFLGPPGTAKTYLAQNICSSIGDAEFFYYFLTHFTTSEELFGPLSLKALEGDEFRRKMEGCLPTSHIGYLDEIFKANSSILNGLLTILNDRKFHDGPEVVDTPLLSIFGASNELPEKDENIETLYDRFLFRYEVKPITFEENLWKLIFENSEVFLPPVNLSVNEILEIREKAKNVGFYDDVMDILMAIRRELRTKVGGDGTQIYISDRRWKKIVNVLKVAAATQGYDKVNRSMLLILEHLLWDHPEQKTAVRRIIIELTISGGKSFDDIEDRIKRLDPEKYSFSKKTIKLPQTVIFRKNNGHSGIGSASSGNVKLLLTLADVIVAGKSRYCNDSVCNFTMNYGDYTYEGLMEALLNEYGISLESQIHDSFIDYRYQVEEIRDEFLDLKRYDANYFNHYKRNLEDNIWVNRRDVDEVVIYHQKKMYEMDRLEKEISKVEQINLEYVLTKDGGNNQNSDQRNGRFIGY
ncbi:AAA family ATPase [Methanogenium sp. MK-MG]|uniref:AAA family ATPase n=1 Tax=Methanogenium sp. MK-MG TaxID=2599926 RepID=UPI0013EB235F|nr:AAA family ATPase [Methanogenium sp. MK-MG]KAF1078592.1 ATPase RavA [Methanogenium sp. MK-MG]